MRALVVQNPTAGGGSLAKDVLCAAIAASGYEPLYFISKTGAYRAVLDQSFDLIAVAGGDGTVAQVLCDLPDRKMPIAIIPSGTANNIAHSLGIFGDPEACARHLAGAPTAPLDVGFATGPWGHRRFLEGIGFGALAHSMALGHRTLTHSLSREARIKGGRRVFHRALAEADPGWFEIDIDGKGFAGRYLFVEVMNIGCTGPALTLSPEAQSGDRLLDIVTLPTHRRAAMLAWLDAGNDAAPMPVDRAVGRKVRVISQSGALRQDDNIWPEPVQPNIVRIGLEETPFDVLVPAAEKV